MLSPCLCQTLQTLQKGGSNNICSLKFEIFDVVIGNTIEGKTRGFPRDGIQILELFINHTVVKGVA